MEMAGGGVAKTDASNSTLQEKKIPIDGGTKAGEKGECLVVLITSSVAYI